MFEKAPKWAWWLVIGFAMFIFALGVWWAKPEKPPAEARVKIPIYGAYDFSSATVPGEIKVPFRPDAITAVTLPPAVVFRTDPSSDIEIIFIDGSQYIDGPGRQVWYGLKRGIFKIRGLKEAGVLKISLEKKT
jgi:hypothetical protein